MLGEDEERLKEAVLLVCEINMGATAIGTGINAHPDYAGLVCHHLRTVTGIPVVTASNLIEATQDCGSFVQLSGVLKRVAVKLSKTCNDLRLLSSGPRVGLSRDQPAADAGRLQHHARQSQPGDPRGRQPDRLRGNRQRRHGELRGRGRPVAVERLRTDHRPQLFKSVNHLRSGCLTLATRCVNGITANREHLRKGVENSIGIVTALNPYIGYANATEIAQEALVTGLSVYDLVAWPGNC